MPEMAYPPLDRMPEMAHPPLFSALRELSYTTDYFMFGTGILMKQVLWRAVEAGSNLLDAEVAKRSDGRDAGQIVFFISMIRTTKRWIPAGASTNQGPEKGDLIPS